MADEVSNDAHSIAKNSELARLTADGVDVDGVIALTGYVGESPNPEVVRLYPDIDDLSVSIDVSKRDILRTVTVPTTAMAGDAVALWVMRTAAVTVRRTRTAPTTAQRARGLLNHAIQRGNAGAPVNRLNLQIAPGTRSGFCWPCSSTCWSQCTMNCSVRPPQ